MGFKGNVWVKKVDFLLHFLNGYINTILGKVTVDRGVNWSVEYHLN